MIDGIIQQVLDNYMINHDIRPSIINAIKQELIEKIKQELKFMKYNDKDQYAFLSITGHKLLGDYLGDNKE